MKEIFDEEKIIYVKRFVKGCELSFKHLFYKGEARQMIEDYIASCTDPAVIDGYYHNEDYCKNLLWLQIVALYNSDGYERSVHQVAEDTYYNRVEREAFIQK